jgi:pimeloyl-ACP methyl ester carboxylesterase
MVEGAHPRSYNKKKLSGAQTTSHQPLTIFLEVFMPFIDIGDIKIYYSITGSGDRLLLFPDNHLSSSAYQDDIAYFSTRFEVITFDYPFTGRSSHEVKYPDEREVDYWGFWADLACHLLIELEIDRCLALGVGGGALTALHFAGKQAPQHNLHVQGLILDSFLADWDARTMHRWLDVREHFYVRNEKTLQEQHGENWRQVLGEDTRFLRQLADQGGYAVPDPILNAIACPTLLTGHLQDTTLPGLAGEYARISSLIPNCSLFLSAKPNHPYLERPFMWTDPETFRTVVSLFLNKYVN